MENVFPIFSSWEKVTSDDAFTLPKEIPSENDESSEDEEMIETNMQWSIEIKNEIHIYYVRFGGIPSPIGYNGEEIFDGRNRHKMQLYRALL